MSHPLSAAELPPGAAPQLRSSCDACNAAKVKCSKGHPQCRRCAARDLPCVYGISMRSAMGRNYRSSSGNSGGGSIGIGGGGDALAYYPRPPSAASRQGRAMTGPYLHEPHPSTTGRSHSAHSSHSTQGATYLSAPIPPFPDQPLMSPPLPAAYHHQPAMYDPSGNSHPWPGSGAEGLQAADPSFMAAGGPLGYLPGGAGGPQAADPAGQYLQQHLQSAGFDLDFPSTATTTQAGEGYSIKPSLDLLASPVQMAAAAAAAPFGSSCLCQQHILRQLYELSLGGGSGGSEEAAPTTWAGAAGAAREIVETCAAAVECQHHRDLQDNLTFFLSLISLLVRATHLPSAGPTTMAAGAAAYGGFHAPYPHARSIGSGGGSSAGSGLDAGEYYDVHSSVGHVSAPLTPRSTQGAPLEPFAPTPPPGLMPAAPHLGPSMPGAIGSSGVGGYAVVESADDSYHRGQLRAEMGRVQQLVDELERRADQDRMGTEARVVGLLLTDLKARLRRNEQLLRAS